MHAQGVKVLAKACNIGSKEALGAVVKELQTVDVVGPIRGVINAAMALEVSETTYTKTQNERLAS
jgi:hypothetical protein